MQTHALTEVTSLSQYPLPSLIASGVSITINTDNMTVSNTTLENEFQKLFDVGLLTTLQAEKIVETAIMHSFLPYTEKMQLLRTAKKRMQGGGMYLYDMLVRRCVYFMNYLTQQAPQIAEIRTVAK